MSCRQPNVVATKALKVDTLLSFLEYADTLNWHVSNNSTVIEGWVQFGDELWVSNGCTYVYEVYSTTVKMFYLYFLVVKKFILFYCGLFIII